MLMLAPNRPFNLKNCIRRILMASNDVKCVCSLEQELKSLCCVCVSGENLSLNHIKILLDQDCRCPMTLHCLECSVPLHWRLIWVVHSDWVTLAKWLNSKMMNLSLYWFVVSVLEAGRWFLSNIAVAPVLLQTHLRHICKGEKNPTLICKVASTVIHSIYIHNLVPDPGPPVFCLCYRPRFSFPNIPLGTDHCREKWIFYNVNACSDNFWMRNLFLLSSGNPPLTPKRQIINNWDQVQLKGLQ